MEKPNDTNQILSVVIIGLNEEQRIGACIDSVVRAVEEIPDTEIAYVDSGSADKTTAIALSKSVRVFKLGTTQTISPAAGRFVGSLISKSKYIMFVDGDTVIARGWTKMAIELMEKDPTVIMFAGQLLCCSSDDLQYPPEVATLGETKQVRQHLGGNRAPILSEAALLASGNWNPFVHHREEEDLIIRMLHFNPDAKILESNQYTVKTPTYPLSAAEFRRRWKRGFVTGPGQAVKSALFKPYLRCYLGIAKPIILALVFYTGLAISIALHLWWQFLVCFYVFIVLRAVISREPSRLYSIIPSLVIGSYSLWEFLTVSARTSKDYVHDFMEIKSNNLYAIQE